MDKYKYNIEVYKPKRIKNRLEYVVLGILGGAVVVGLTKLFLQ